MVIVTGMSGAGKSTALKVLEDIGYFCVDNLPIPLFLKFVEMSAQPDANLDKVAIGIDIRGGRSFARLAEELDVLKEKEIPHEILYLDAGDDVLVKRYKETRRSHPLAKDGRLDKGIAAETVLLIFAVSQFTFRFTAFLISLRIRTFSSSIRDTCASMILSISTNCAPSFKYTTYIFLRATIFASMEKLHIILRSCSAIFTVVQTISK